MRASAYVAGGGRSRSAGPCGGSVGDGGGSVTGGSVARRLGHRRLRSPAGSSVAAAVGRVRAGAQRSAVPGLGSVGLARSSGTFGGIVT